MFLSLTGDRLRCEDCHICNLLHLTADKTLSETAYVMGECLSSATFFFSFSSLLSKPLGNNRVTLFICSWQEEPVSQLAWQLFYDSLGPFISTLLSTLHQNGLVFKIDSLLMINKSRPFFLRFLSEPIMIQQNVHRGIKKSLNDGNVTFTIVLYWSSGASMQSSSTLPSD